MTIFTSTQSVVHPGRLQDAVALAGHAGKLLERHGASDARLLTAVQAGEATGTLVLNAEYADGEAYGASADALTGDAELQRLMDEVRSPQSPITMMGQMLTSTVPLDRTGNPQRGSYVEVHISQLTPGRMEDMLDASRRAADYVESRGATNAQLATTFLAGSSSNRFVFSFEVPSLKAFGKLADSWTSEPEGLALYTSFLGADPADVEVFSGLYAVVPL